MANGNGLPPGLLGRRQKIPPPPQMEMLPDTLTGPERETYYRIFQQPQFNRMSQEEKDKFMREIGQRPMHGLLQDSPGSYLDLMKSIYEEWPNRERPDLPFPDVQSYRNTDLGDAERSGIPEEDVDLSYWGQEYGDEPSNVFGRYRLPRQPRSWWPGPTEFPSKYPEGLISVGHYGGWGKEVGDMERRLENTLGHETFHAISSQGHGYGTGVSPQTSFAAAVRTLGRKSEGVGDWVGDEDEDGKTVDFTSLGPLSPEGAMNYLLGIARKNYAEADISGRGRNQDLIDAELEAMLNRLLALPTYRDHPIQAKGLGDWTTDDQELFGEAEQFWIEDEARKRSTGDQRHGLLAPYTGFLAEVERE